MAKSQPNMLGKTAEYIKAYSNSPRGIGTYDSEGANSDGTSYLQFSAKNDPAASFRYYLNKAGICHWFVIMQPAKDMVGMIQTLNEKYQKFSDNEWLDKSNTIHITLTFKPGDKIFTTGFARVQ